MPYLLVVVYTEKEDFWDLSSHYEFNGCFHYRVCVCVCLLQVLSWFADSPSPLCPFSLHAMMQVAVRLGNRPGDWFGPSQLAILIR